MATARPQPFASSSLLARNATLNLLAEFWTFLVLIVVMPKLVFLLGETRFGLFSLAWVTIGYLAFLDIGVNRAATKFVSEHLADQDFESTRRIVATALLSNLGLGLLGGLAVALASPYLIHHVFRVSPDLEGHARLTFYAVAIAIPISLVQGVLRAVLTSYQRFGWINLVNALTTTGQWALACGFAWAGYGVAAVILAIVAARIVASVAYGGVLLRLLPGIHFYKVADFKAFWKLLGFGSWVTISQLVSPILVYLDRVVIASFVSLAAVTLYTVPFEGITKLRVIPSSLASTLYPAFGERGGRNQSPSDDLQRLYAGSVRYLLLVTLPCVLFLVVLGPDLLTLWMGRDFARQASVVLQILGIGVLVNSIANVPYCALQALGRPDITGKLHLLELPFYVALCCFLVFRYGIVGAASANTVRLAVDAALLFGAAWQYSGLRLSRQFAAGALRIVGVGVFLSILLLGSRFVVTSAWGRLGLGSVGTGLYFLAVWVFVLDTTDKPQIHRALRMIVKQPAS